MYRISAYSVRFLKPTKNTPKIDPNGLGSSACSSHFSPFQEFQFGKLTTKFAKQNN